MMGDINSDGTHTIAVRRASFQRVTPACSYDEYLKESTYKERKIHILPTLAEEFFNDVILPKGWTPTMKIIFAGTRDTTTNNNNNDDDEGSPLSMLRAHEDTLIRQILSFLIHPWSRHVKLTVPAPLVGKTRPYAMWSRIRFDQGRLREKKHHRVLLDEVALESSNFNEGFVAFSRVGFVNFPEPNNRNVNMVPFIFGNKNSLPGDLQCYHGLIESCPYDIKERGKVGYLTIHESFIDAGKTQRRQGLHIEAPGTFCDIGDVAAFTPATEHHWGIGIFHSDDKFTGGIYMASNVDGTSKVWDSLVDKRVSGIVDRHGGCEHLRNIIGQGTELRKGELIWMTDCTPHEALPQTTSGVRQFFRIVTPYVSHWYADHSTENPKVPLPDHVNVVHGNKFRIFGE